MEGEIRSETPQEDDKHVSNLELEKRNAIYRTCDRICCCSVCKPWSHRHCAGCCILGLSIAVGVFFIVLAIGASIESSTVQNAPSTAWFYKSPHVCARQFANKSAKSSGSRLLTFANVTTAHIHGGAVAHCGDCGRCSNVHDISVYNVTRNSLTKTSTSCATKAFLSRDAVSMCFNQEVGFTSGCTECWVDNVMCDLKACVFTCLQMIIFRQQNNLANGRLNACLTCDESLCGPQFIACAGANRRRSGIISDIARNDTEVCKFVDAGWNNSPQR
jgi:hypothetical protein